MTQFGFTKKQIKMIEVIVLLNAMALSILLPTAQSTGEIGQSCFNPPALNPNPPSFGLGNIPQPSNPYNPNPCHIYSWKNFPTDHGATPTTGLFNNDTSYYFPVNVTGVSSFTVCFQAVTVIPSLSTLGDNDTLFLQFLNTTSSWMNASQNTGGSASISADSPDMPTTICSNTFGHLIPNLTSNCSIITTGTCLFRIAGNQQCVAPCLGNPPYTIIISELNIQFYYSTIVSNVISCTAITRLTTSATLACGRNISTLSQSITIGWRATNSTGSGCGTTGQNCWRSGTSTCSFTSSANLCTVSASFSPAFVGTPSVIVDWNVINGAGVFTPPSFTYPLLT